MKSRLVVSWHAIERLRERRPRYARRSNGDLYGVVYGMTQHALPWGAQLGDHELLLGDPRAGSEGLVFVVMRDRDGDRIVKTVLTEDQAMANMQATGLLKGMSG
jgi:hypothetical protein